MSPTIRAALTETVSIYHPMPTSLKHLEQVAGQLDDIRTVNIEHHVALIAKAAQSGANIVCLGELFPLPYFALAKTPMWLSAAEDASSGPSVQACQRAAAQNKIAVIAPIYELDHKTKRRFNTAVVIDQHGEIAGKYRKTHIPSGTNEQGTFCEDFYYQASDGQLENGPKNIADNPFFPVFDLGVARVGIAICYDRHFPQVLQALAEGGAELIFSPAITFGKKSERMWPLESAVDAARNYVFIGASNRLGCEMPWNQRYYGQSHFVGPAGKLPLERVHPHLMVADLPLAELGTRDPSGWKLRSDRRPEIY